MTWTALLGKWMQFAQASVAVPIEANGPQWRASVPSIIALQAVTFALGDLELLPADERPLALDKAELLVRNHRAQLQSTWRGGLMPRSVGEVVDDAAAALASRLPMK